MDKQHNREFSGRAVYDQFRGITKLIAHGKGRGCEVNDEADQ